MTQATTSTVDTEPAAEIGTALEKHTISGLLNKQQSLNPSACGTDYRSVADTALPSISLDTLTPGELLYDPRNVDAVLEVIEQYENDFGEQKLRLRVHTDDYRNGRVYSYFAHQATRDLSPIKLKQGEPTEEQGSSTRTSTTEWSPKGTVEQTSDTHTQATLTEPSPANSSESVTESTSDSTTSDSLDDTHTQATLFE